MKKLPVITVCSPGKAILHGEHAVVYGKKAIACSINATIQVELFQSCEEDDLKVDLPNLSEDSLSNCFCISLNAMRSFYQCQLCENENSINGEENWQQCIKKFVLSVCSEDERQKQLLVSALSVFVSAYVKIILEEGKLDFPPLSVRVMSHHLPLGAGLGSSAAYSVSLATAFLVYAEQLSIKDNIDYRLEQESLLKINDMAFFMEKLVHGNPSGIDNSVSTYGGAIIFNAGNVKRCPSFPKLELLIVDSHTLRSTKALVASVRHKVEKFPKLMNSLFQSIHEISEAAEETFTQMPNCVDQNSYSFLHEKLKELIRMNQHLLNCIGVGHPNLDTIYSLAEKYGFACKLTGAGGGGCAIILLDPKASVEQVQSLQNEITSNNFTSWKAVLGGNGVNIIQCDSRFLLKNH